MFQEVLDVSLQFIGVHSSHDGCNSIQLAEFLQEDVFPYYGWASNASLRNTVVRLLVAECHSSFLLHRTEEAVVQPRVQRDPTHTKVDGKAAPLKDSIEDAGGNAGWRKGLGEPLPPLAALELLDRGDVRWSADMAVKPVLHFCAAPALSERVFGIRLTSDSMRESADFAAANAMQGWDMYHNTPENARRYKHHLITSGLTQLRKKRLVTQCFLVDRANCSVRYRYFPTFAQPLTEIEKSNQWRAATHTNAEGPFAAAEPQSSVDLVRMQRCRGSHPIVHYFQRKRQEGGLLQYDVLDLAQCQQIVSRSPDRTLLLPDAIHCILATHGIDTIRPESFNRHNRRNLRVVLSCAGLRVVVASVIIRGQRREVRLVIPAEDLKQRLNHRKRRRVEEGGALEDSTEYLREDDSGDEVGEGGSAVDDNSDNEETSSVKVDRESMVLANAAVALEPFYVSPEWPFVEMQVGREAERRPVAVSSVYPQMSFNYPEKARLKNLGSAVDTYVRTRRTLSVSYTLAKHGKTFTRLLMSKKLAASTSSAFRDLKAEPEDPTVAVAPPPQPGEDSSPLPRGLSQYAVDVVLATLEATPHRAMSLPRLQTKIDYTVLHRRLLPYLRAQEKIVTTGFSVGRRRVGIVALAGANLDDAIKRELVEEVSKNRGTTTTRTTVEGTTAKGNVIRTDIVLSELPAPADGAVRSAHGQRLTEVRPSTKRLVHKVMIIRNGYARHPLCRAGRLHLELWYQWYRSTSALQGAGGPFLAPADTVLNMQTVFEAMTLSTFCVVVGFAAYDVGTVLVMMSGSDDEENVPTVPTGTVRWDTPLSALPPSMQTWCRSQGMHTVLHSLHLLQERQLIRCNTRIDSFLVSPLAKLNISLMAEGRVGWRTYVLHCKEYTPSSTMCSVLRYWQPEWNALSHVTMSHSQEVFAADSNLSLPRLAVLSRLTRTEPSNLAEIMYQCGGTHRNAQRERLGERRDGRKKVTRRAAGVRLARPFRTEVCAATVSEALAVILSEDSPRRALDDLVHHIERTRRAHNSRQAVGALPVVRHPEAEYNRFHNCQLLHMAILSDDMQVIDTASSSSSATLPSEVARLQRSVAAVFSPDLSVSLPAPTSVCGEGLPARHRPTDPVHYQPRQPPALSDSLEVEALRMVLLSDKAHYRPTQVKELLLQFNGKDLARARNYLQRLPAFKRKPKDLRVPELGLASPPHLFTMRVMRSAPRPCANMALLHSWAAHLDDAAVCCTQGQPSAQLLQPAEVRGEADVTAVPFDVSVLAQSVMDVHKPAASDCTLAEASINVLRVPTLAWPAHSYALEEDLQRLQEVKRHAKRPRHASREWAEEQGRADEAEDTEVKCETTRNLYPSRTLAFAEGCEITGLEVIPTDGAPTEEDREAVTAAMAYIRAVAKGVGQPILPAKTTAPLPYPSIFHHADGTFHTYVWKAFIFSLHRLITRMPGVSHPEVLRMGTESGLLSPRAIEAGLAHLLACHAIVSRTVLAAASLSDGPFAAVTTSTASEGTATYTVTVLPQGLWNVLDTYGKENSVRAT